MTEDEKDDDGPKRKGRLVNSPEIMAMADIGEVLDGLDPPAAYRVLSWLNLKYDWPDSYESPAADPNDPRR